jgi:O-antigen ligase
VFWLLPLLLPLIVVIALIAPNLYPTLLPTFTSRVKASPGTDINVIWRDRAREVSLEGVDDSLLTGIGFGRPARFMLQGQLQDVTGDPHNSYVYLLAGGGLIALGSLLVVMLAYVIDVVRRYRRAVDIERTLLVWSLCTWFAFMTNAFYGPVLSDALMLMTIWILMTLPQCVLLRRGDDSAPDESASPSP